ncbi:MAG: potassium transporter TrkG [Candidatus Fermentibacteraceae bacterium]
MKRFGGLVYGFANCLLVMVLFAARHYFQISGGSLLQSVTVFFVLESVLFALAPFLTKREGLVPDRRTPWFMVMNALLIAVVMLHIASGFAGWNARWIPEPGVTVSVYAFLMAGRVILRAIIRLAGRLNPALVLPASFLITVLFGALLLMHPKATPEGFTITFTDAFFTSASATCVTGLTVIDTEKGFTGFGQFIILLLIQTGGLGIMTFAAFFALSLGQNLSLRDAFSLSRLMDSDFISDLKQIILSIIMWTLVIEIVGALMLMSTWRGLRPHWGAGELIWQSVFHSVSAFCNAGFSLNSNGLEGFSGSPATSMIMGSLIVLGGMGFGVLTAIAMRWVGFIRTGRRVRLPIQARFVCLMTFVLIIIAYTAFLGLEWNNTLKGMNLEDKLANSFLQAVTPRTAGFNTVPTASLLPQIRWLFILLMFVGASPGGTGGGVKTTALGLMLLSTRSLITGRLSPEIWKRRIPNFDLRRAGAIFTIGFVVFSVSAFSLLLSERDSIGPREPMEYVFESMSAFGTVGLSTGVTPGLTTLGRWIVIITMFIGRTVPATLAAATFRVDSAKYLYPEARVTIG